MNRGGNAYLVWGIALVVLMGLLALGINTGTGLARGGNQNAVQSVAHITANDLVESPGLSVGEPFVVSGADFHTDGFFPDSVFFDFTTGGWEGRAAGDGCMVAAVALPNGVTVTEVMATFVDNDGSNHINFDLYRVDTGTGTVDNMAYFNTTSFPASPAIEQHSTTFIDHPVVAVPDYMYFATTCLPTAETKLFGLVVFMVYP